MADLADLIERLDECKTVADHWAARAIAAEGALSRLRAALTEARIWICENTEADEIAESKADELLAKIDAALGGQHGQ